MSVGEVVAAGVKCPLTSPHKDCAAVTYREYGTEYTQVWPSESDAKASLRYQGIEKNIVKVVRIHAPPVCICDFDGEYDDGLRVTRIPNPACPVDHDEEG